MRIAFSRSETVFRGEMGRMNPRRKYELMRSYQSKYDNAAYGSALKDHYNQMKSIVSSY
jgi:hypothetical protein